MQKHKPKGKLKSAPISELERAWEKVIAWFFAYPEDEVSLVDIVDQVGISKTNANEVVTQLEKIGFLDKKVLGKMWRIKANGNHPYFITKKIPQNLMHIYESSVIGEINKQIPGVRSIILFGSYRKGDDIPGSDVDIAVEVLDNEPLEIVEFGTMAQLGYRKNVKVNLHIFSRNKINLNTFVNIANGIVLQGVLEVRP
ncbi:MAG: nucleotidyltransferase domain-containing protein [Candidatus Nanoarchaeia archaeon]|nr:nucleotidyltransferase domain-containing protein [Candidatus Nanoarchaeia archaeon]